MMGCSEDSRTTLPALEGAASELSSHAALFDLSPWAGEDFRLRCWGEGEAQVVSGVADAEPYSLYGLLADADYACALEAPERTAEVGIHTGPLEAAAPVFAPSGDPAAIDHGYVLLNVFADGMYTFDQLVMVVDELGRVRWSWPVPDGCNGDVDTTYQGDGRFLIGGGEYEPPQFVGLDGVPDWMAPPAPTGEPYHHQAQLDLDGNVIGLSSVMAELAGGVKYQSHWAGAWRVDDSSLAWSYALSTGVERGQLTLHVGGQDPFHLNTAVAVTDWAPCDLFISMKNLSEMACIDLDTQDVVWAFGGDDNDFTMVDEAGVAVTPDFPEGQHAPEVHGDHVFVFDNGTRREGAVQTRADEYVLDPVARTARLLWTYSEEGWYEGIWGAVHLLPNANVLIAKGHCNDCDEADPDQFSQVVVIDPDQQPVWRLDFVDHDEGMYRASVIDPCTLFGNTTYCPSLDP